MSERPHLFGLRAPELVRELADRGVECTEAEARRVLSHVVSNLAPDLRAMKRPVRRELAAAIDHHFDRRPLEIVDRAIDPHDHFVKYLLRSPDGALHEAVRIPLHREGRYTVCLSSQVGCAMRCDFCATGRLGLSRNLHAWEMVAAWAAVRRELGSGALSGAVFQGQGEPFHNYEQVIRAASILRDPCGGRIRAENITISTVGLVPQIRRYAREGHPFRVIVSLTSAVAERRKALLPVAGRFELAELREALRELAAASGQRVTIAWVLLGGVNHGADEIEHLRALVSDLPVRVNLIDVNDAREGGYRRASDEERNAFVDALQVLEAPIVRRYSGGREREAACGMLAATRWGKIDDAAAVTEGTP